VVHNTALNSSHNFHPYPPDNHHSSESDDVYWTEGLRRVPSPKQSGISCMHFVSAVWWLHHN